MLKVFETDLKWFKLIKKYSKNDQKMAKKVFHKRLQKVKKMLKIGRTMSKIEGKPWNFVHMV